MDTAIRGGTSRSPPAISTACEAPAIRKLGWAGSRGKVAKAGYSARNFAPTVMVLAR
jgi:hypothetical protein